MSDLVFYRNDGLAAVGHIDGTGKFVNTGSQKVHTQNWSIIVPATSFGNELLFYRNDGLASVGPIHPSGIGNQTPIQNLTHNWSKIIPVIDHSITFGSRNLLFYRNDGRAAVGHIITEGEFNIYTFVNTDNKNNFTENWSQIVVGSQHRSILFYRNDGRIAVGHIEEGIFVNTFSGNIAQNWSKIISVSEPSEFPTEHFLFYNNDGSAAVGHIEGPADELVITDSINNFTQNWSQIVAIGTDIMFYRNDGIAAVGHIAFGKFVNTDTINNFTQNWSQIITFGNSSDPFSSAPNQLLFYRNDGRAAVGHIHFVDGKFVNTDAVDNFTENWSQIVDTPLLIS